MCMVMYIVMYIVMYGSVCGNSVIRFYNFFMVIYMIGYSYIQSFTNIYYVQGCGMAWEPAYAVSSISISSALSSAPSGDLMRNGIYCIMNVCGMFSL